MKLRCLGKPASWPSEPFVALGDHGAFPLNERSARAVSQRLMLSALNPAHAERLIEDARGQDRGAERVSAGVRS